MNERYTPITKTIATLAVVAGSVVVVLAIEHWPHVLPYVPWLLLAACPLMHVFMHHGKQGAGGRHSLPLRGHSADGRERRSPVQ